MLADAWSLLERMMKEDSDWYRDLDGRRYSLVTLDDNERELIKQLQARAASGADWVDYSNYWMATVNDFYHARGLSRQQIQQTVAFRVGQDQASRIGVASGMMRHGDYRDELEELITVRFKTRRAFCEATGLSEDMLSHVLNKRKHLAIDTLVDALARVGYTIHIAEAAATAEAT
jgi:hypothetical protein